MHQFYSIVDSKWNSLIVSKPKECITNATQQFIVEASLLSRKWQDKVDNFQEFRKRSLKIVPMLGLSFEKEKSQKAEAGSESNSEPKGKKKQQANREAMENMKN
jgi:single-stranded DNA-binding protein